MLDMDRFRSFLVGLFAGAILVFSFFGGALVDRFYGLGLLDGLIEQTGGEVVRREILDRESAVVDVVESVQNSVVTVSITTAERRVLQFDPFGGGLRSRIQGGVEQDIGTGFIVGEDGLIVTNKHVVEDDDSEYKVITYSGEEYEVEEIVRDPTNDLAIVRIDLPVGERLEPLELGDSDNLKVGQFVIAIGTALGEFRSTVTTGVISGLGRGIEAGSPFEGYVERLDDVIQTDAAINPGNSGGPLLNSDGEVIGINTAVSTGAENIGFALPVNLIKDGLEEFERSGNFASKPFLGVTYQMISQEAALLNEVPRGAYVLEVTPGSGADEAGIEAEDIITRFEGERVSEHEEGLAGLIEQHSPGDRVEIEIWRDLPAQVGGETLEVTAVLSSG